MRNSFYLDKNLCQDYSFHKMMGIREDFCANYLNTHHRYLDGIWALGIPSQEIKIPQDVITSFRNRKESDQEKSLKNLRNAWYHECSFLFQYDNQDEWLKFASWRIIQFYYSIYCMISAMMRCVDSYPEIGHVKMLNRFTTEFVMNNRLNSELFASPFCFYIKSGNIHPLPQSRIIRPYSLQNDLPQLKDCLNYACRNSQKPVSIFHYFKCLREWATYENSYILMSLYGPTIRSDLSRYLQRILWNFLNIGEKFLVAFWGDEVITAELNSFEAIMTEINGFQPKTLEARFQLI